MSAPNKLRPVIALLCSILLVASAGKGQSAPEPSSKPKIRAITAFVHLDRGHYQDQIQDALKFLRGAKAAYEKSGYEVQTIRITTQSFPEYTRGLSEEQTLAFFREYDALAVKEGFDASIGPAMMKDTDDPREAELLGKILANAKTLEGSIFIGGEDGIHWKSIQAAAGVMKYLEANTLHSQGNFSFTTSSFVPDGTPFYPASYLASEGKRFAIGLQSANVVADALASSKSPELAEEHLKASLTTYAQQVEKTAKEISRSTGWRYGGIDLSPAGLKDVSIGRAIENFLGAPVGSSGTLTTAALITRALKSVPVTQAGYSGLMLPILEDSVLSQRWTEGRLSLDAMLSYSAVCGTGLDVIPLPGDVSIDQLAAILGDVASLSVKWHKPLSARLLPVAGKRAGDQTEFDDPFLVNAKIQPLP
ncbi:MAG: DUF711 family protein [Candidatus Acidiferrales bacterium]|jgi:uncharacterized protein (UPF0210 family)